MSRRIILLCGILVSQLLFSSCKKEDTNKETEDVKSSIGTNITFSCNKDLSFGKRTIKILFIGNSLTYTNDLPSMVCELASFDSSIIISKSITLPNYSFEDHLIDGLIQKEIASGYYQFVIGQQGPSALPESQNLLLRDASIIADQCKKVNSKLILYMVWPASSRSFDHDNVILSYTNAAIQTSSLLAPAGLAWKHAWAIDSNLELYSSDGFHPSVKGTLLSALTIYGAITTKKDFESIKYEMLSLRKDVNLAEFSILKKSALKALGN
jgi:hypothetical protein